MLKMCIFSSTFNIKMATQNFTNFDFFKIHADMTAVTIQCNKIVSNEVKANEWIQKLWYIYTMEFYAAERKKELIPFATAWMELESIMLSEISQGVRDKYHMISPLTGT